MHPLASQLLTLTQLSNLLDEHRTTVWRKVKSGLYPQPIHISPGRAVFVKDEVQPFIDRAIANREPSVTRSSRE
jgi:predicted DNA-binding transcriptional regulator AlpA